MNAILQPEIVLTLLETMSATAFMDSHISTVTNTAWVLTLICYYQLVRLLNF